MMNEDHNLVESLFQRIRELSLTYIELIKLKAVDKVSSVLSAFLPDLIIILLLVIFLFFLNLALAFWLGDMFGKVYFGFLAVASLYFVLGMVSHFFLRGWFKKVTSGYFIRQFFR